MKARSVLSLVALLAVSSQTAFGDGRIDEWVTKGRAALGSEEALNAVTSVRYTGTLETTEKIADKDDPTKVVDHPLRLAIDIVFQKPCQQRYILRSDKIVETTALDDYDGWIRRSEIGKDDQWQLTLLDATQIKRLRANTWENLSFYRGIEQRGGKVEFQDEATVDGKPCVVLAFKYAENISFTRYFEKSTGLLVKTVTENGGEIREQGEVIEKGVRYPKILINKAPNGQVTTITFDSIKVNEPVAASEFTVPAMIVNEATSTSAK
jgi:hypothetical protein